MLKVLQITPSYKPAYIYGGPTISVAGLCEELSKTTDLQVLTTRANGNSELDVPEETQMVEGVRVNYFRRLTKDHSHFSPALTGYLWKHAREYDVVHIHSWWNMVAILSALVCKMRQVPFVLSPRGMFSVYTLQRSFSKRVFNQLVNRFLLKGVVMHATSELEKQQLLECWPSNSVVVLPNIISLAVVPPVRSESTRFRLLFLSRIHPVKGMEYLFRALKGLEIPYRLTVAGEGTEGYVDSLKTLAEDLGIAEHIDWVGPAGVNNKFDLIAAHDLLVLTSLSENFANIIPEALSVGTTVLISDRVGMAEYVKKHDLGWVCMLNDEILRAALAQAFAAKDKRERISRTAPVLIHHDFSPAVITQQYLKVYESLMKKGNHE